MFGGVGRSGAWGGDISSVVERERRAVGEEEGERDTKKTREVGER